MLVVLRGTLFNLINITFNFVQYKVYTKILNVIYMYQ